jgi:hypothetical protein
MFNLAAKRPAMDIAFSHDDSPVGAPRHLEDSAGARRQARKKSRNRTNRLLKAEILLHGQRVAEPLNGDSSICDRRQARTIGRSSTPSAPDFSIAAHSHLPIAHEPNLLGT